MAKPRIAWDSSVLLAYWQQEEGRYCILRQHIERAENDEFDIVLSLLAAAECGRIDRIPDADDQETYIQTFLDQPYVVPVQLDQWVAAKAREIVRVGGIPGADAVHIASALRAKADALLAYDQPHMTDRSGAFDDLRIQKPGWRNEQPPLIGQQDDGSADSGAEATNAPQ